MCAWICVYVCTYEPELYSELYPKLRKTPSAPGELVPISETGETRLSFGSFSLMLEYDIR